MKVISVLGCGWYGFALSKCLINNGFIVKGSTTSPDKLAELSGEGIQPYLINLNDKRLPDSSFFECDVLIVAIPPKIRSGQGDAYLPKLNKAIDAAILNQVKRVVLISSTGIYADLNCEVDELTDPQPAAESGKILLLAESLFQHQNAFKTTIIRFGGLIGPGREPGKFFIDRVAIQNGLAPVNLIHQNDCIGITLAILKNNAFGYTFNACTPHHPAKMEFYTKAAVKAGLPSPDFLPELNEWKKVSSIYTESVLNYSYHIKNWMEWLE